MSDLSTCSVLIISLKMWLTRVSILDWYSLLSFAVSSRLMTLSRELRSNSRQFFSLLEKSSKSYLLMVSVMKYSKFKYNTKLIIPIIEGMGEG
jgi:hypothetical protein